MRRPRDRTVTSRRRGQQAQFERFLRLFPRFLHRGAGGNISANLRSARADPFGKCGSVGFGGHVMRRVGAGILAAVLALAGCKSTTPKSGDKEPTGTPTAREVKSVVETSSCKQPEGTKTPLQWLTYWWPLTTAEERKLFDNYRAGLRSAS